MAEFTEWMTAIPYLNYVTLGFVDIHHDATQDIETCRSFASNIVRPATKNLIFHNCTFPTPILVALFSELMLNTEMKEFSLTEGSPNNVDWKALPSILQFQCPEKLQDLTLENLHMYQMTDTALESDMAAMSKMANLQVLNLSKVSFRTSGPRLAAAMSKWPRELQLRKLDLTRCYIQNDAAQQISKVIANCRNIQNLLLAYNNFHHCTRILFAAANKYTNLEIFDLGDNGMCGEDLVAVGNAMLDGNVPQLKHITFSGLTDVNEDHVNHFLDAVASQSHRQWRIDLGRCKAITPQFRKEWLDKLNRISHLRL